MKNIRNQTLLTILLFTASLVLFSACRKDPEEIIALISESEAAEIIETSVAERSAGWTAPAVSMAEIVDLYAQSCGASGDTTIQKNKSTGVATYGYVFNMDWLVNCNNLNIPVDATTHIAGNGSFATAHWTGTDATNGNLTFTGLDLQSPEYIANGSYTLQGDITGNLRRTNPTFNCKTELTLTGLKINKSTYAITGGTGSATVTGTTGSGQSKTFTGTLTFNGDGTVTVVVNGYTYTFQLQ